MGRTHWGILLAGLGVLTACSDKSLVVLHDPPQVEILEPADGAVVYDGQEILFRAQVSTTHAGDNLLDLKHIWVNNTETMCASTNIESADGDAFCSYAFPKDGEQTVTVTVTDTQGDSASDAISVTVLENVAPTVEILDPLADDFFEPGDLVQIDALVEDDEDDSSDLTVEVSSSADGDLGFSGTPASDGSYTAATSSLSSGLHLLVVRATDPSGRSGQDSVQIRINGRPAAPTVSITPDPAPSGEALQAVIDVAAVDPEGDTVSYVYDWYVDGSLYASGTNPKVAKGITVRDEFWEVYVTPKDAYGYGEPGLADITIDNGPPSLDSITLTPSSPGTEDDVLATPVGWFDQDSDPEKYKIRWYFNGSVDTAETTDTYPASKTVRGDQIQAEFTPYDAFDSGDAVLSPTVTVGNSTPTTPGVSISPTSPEPEDDLTCSVSTASTDADGDTLSYLYTWYQNGSLTSITTYKVDDSYTEHGDTWECRVTATDGLSTSSAGTASVTVSDVTSPDAPVIETPTTYRNEDEVDLEGDCEADCTLTFTCSDSSSSWTETDTCDSDGTFSYTMTALTRGDTTSCYADCEDAAGNVSSASNTVSTEVCDPYDTYEDDTGYGDTISDAIDLWSTLADDGSTTITIEANALSYSDRDWYVISTSDSVSADVAAGQNDYNFELDLSVGSSDYEVYVYKASSVSSGYPSTKECSTTSSGATSYSDYVSTRACSSGNAYGYNNCEDMSDTYYILVQHLTSTALSCQEYELTITNGVW